MTLKKIYKIIADYASGKSTDDDFREEMDVYPFLFPEKEIPELSSDLEDSIWKNIQFRAASLQEITAKMRRKNYMRYAAIISGFIIIVAALVVYSYHVNPIQKDVSLREELIKYKENPSDSVWALITSERKLVALNSIKENELYKFDGQEIIRHKDTLIYVKGSNKINGMHVPARHMIHIKMNDGTVITANANTLLSYNTDYLKSHTRLMAIDGEALFRVVHNPKNPFAVVTDKDTLFDIGTSFTVKNFMGDSTMFAGVSEGCIQVGKTLVDKGSEVKVDYTSGHAVIGKSDIRTSLFWNSDVFCFRQAGMAEVVHSLERWYGVKINCERQTDFTFSGNLPKRLPLTKILAIINELSESSLKISDKNI